MPIYCVKRAGGTSVYLDFTPRGGKRVRKKFRFVQNGLRHSERLKEVRRLARDELKRMLAASDNRISLRYGLEREDKYRRTLAHIYLPNGQNLQATLLEKGLATAYTTPPNASQSDCYRQAELKAQKHRIGIWSLAQYQVKQVTQLSRQDRGFRIIEGTVTSLHETDKATWLKLDQQLSIRINARDRHYFSSAHLQQMKNRKVQLRGWLHPNKKGFFLNLRHPSAITPVH